MIQVRRRGKGRSPLSGRADRPDARSGQGVAGRSCGRGNVDRKVIKLYNWLMSEQSPELTPITLPVVKEGVVDAVAGEMSGRNIVAEMGRRLSDDQPELARFIGNYIVLATGDPQQQQRLFEVAMLTYRLLEAQVESDNLGAQLYGPGPESPTA